MKILFFTEIYDKGGIDTFIINLLNNWPKKNDYFYLIYNDKYLGISNIKSRLNKEIKFITYKEKNFFFLQKFFRLFIFFIKVFFVYKIFRNIEYDQLFTINGGYPGGDYCRASLLASKLLNSKIKTVHNIHNLAQNKSFFNFISEVIVDFLLSRNTDQIITVSKSSLHALDNIKLFKHINKCFIYNGLDDSLVSSYIDSKLIDNFNIPSNHKIILMLATYEQRKGHIFLLKSLRKVLDQNKNVILILCGYGTKSEIQNILSEVSRLKLINNVIINNFIFDINSLINYCDLLILPSLCNESFGYALVEAMQRKKPVIGTNIGGINEVIENNSNGYIVDVDDVEGLSNRLLMLLKNRSLRNKFGSSGYKIYQKKFTAKKMSKKYYLKITKLSK